MCSEITSLRLSSHCLLVKERTFKPSPQGSENFDVILPLQAEDKQRAGQQFTKLQAAMKVLGVSSEEQKALWLILGAIYHLGAAGATKGRNSWLNECRYRVIPSH